MCEIGQIERILTVIGNIANGEVNLPLGDQTAQFERIRQVGQGYTTIGATG